MLCRMSNSELWKDSEYQIQVYNYARSVYTTLNLSLVSPCHHQLRRVGRPKQAAKFVKVACDELSWVLMPKKAA